MERLAVNFKNIMFNYNSVYISNKNERVQISTFGTRDTNVKLKHVSKSVLLNTKGILLRITLDLTRMYDQKLFDVSKHEKVVYMKIIIHHS